MSMKPIRRTIRRRTIAPYRGRLIILTVPPYVDCVSVRQKGTRRSYDIALSTIYDLAVRQYVARNNAIKKAKRGRK